MSESVYVNGKFVPKSEAKVSVFDRGYLYGDGVFEGIRGYNARIFRLDQHLERLYRGAKAIALDIPLTPEELKDAIIETVRRNGLRDCYIRLIVSRGEGDLGLNPMNCHTPATIVVIASHISLYPREVYEQGLDLLTCTTRKNLLTALNPEIKSLNYLNNILARIEAVRAGAHEGLMLNHLGYVAEGTGDNVFIVRGGVLRTPPAYVGILEGITRQVVLELAEAMDLPAREEALTLYELYTADECFLTGTAAEIVPVARCDGRVIGDGKPGPITKRLMEQFREVTVTEGVPVG
ncbi:MAG: branched-chain-amino-acid transaminase [Armatimonadetes bacterium]|nr:branched-chain-amino-acid transaminase [Armatimonadota bacterium]